MTSIVGYLKELLFYSEEEEQVHHAIEKDGFGYFSWLFLMSCLMLQVKIQHRQIKH